MIGAVIGVVSAVVAAILAVLGWVLYGAIIGASKKGGEHVYENREEYKQKGKKFWESKRRKK